MKKNKTVSKKTVASKLKIKPLFDRVLIKPYSLDEYNKNKFGIIVPETVDKEKPEEGVVVAVGEGRYDDGIFVPVKVRVGDKVLFSKYGYDEIKIDGEEYLMLKEENILAIINN